MLAAPDKSVSQREAVSNQPQSSLLINQGARSSLQPNSAKMANKVRFVCTYQRWVVLESHKLAAVNRNIRWTVSH